MSFLNGIFVRTNLMYSKPMSDIAKQEVLIKLENTQPSGSFKLRGLSLLCQEKIEQGCTRLMATSGGNAGMATAYSAQMLGVPCDIYVPEYVPERMIRKLQAYNAKVTKIGKDWQDANDAAMKLVNNDPKIGFIHPYEGPVIWKGHSTMIHEIKEDLQGRKPSCIVCSVGGGGMAMGVLQGLEEVGWEDVPVLCMETEGAECFHLSMEAGKIVVLNELPSIAKTLGARSVTPKLFHTAQKRTVITHVLPDKDAANGCIRLADDHGFLVEASCGVTMASIYSNVLPGIMERRGIRIDEGPIILIGCGGRDISHEMLVEYSKMFDLSLKDSTIPGKDGLLQSEL
jgi:L-serine/L-threonine ammonia-lyase